MLDRVSAPPPSSEILRRLVADELFRRHGPAIDFHSAVKVLRAEVPHEISDDEIVVELIHQATHRRLALDFDRCSSSA